MTVGQLPGLVKSHWRVWLVGYLLWLSAFAIVEGTGRQVCAMPMQKWIDAAANPQERYVRGLIRDRADECLHLTRWYSYSVAGLFALGLAAPLGGMWIIMRQAALDDIGRARPAGVTRPFSGLQSSALAFGAVLVVSLAVILVTMVAVRLAYDHLG